MEDFGGEMKSGKGKKEELKEGKWETCHYLGETHPWTPLPWLSWQPWKSLEALKRKCKICQG